MIVYFILFLLFSIVDGKGALAVGIYTTLLVLSIFARLILPFAIYYDAKDKRLNSKTMWTILTLIFSIPVAIIYAIATKKADDTKENIKTRRYFTVLTIISYIILIVAFFSLIAFGDKTPVDFDKSSYCTYENDEGVLIIYDKMGNDYTFEELDSGKKEFLYFDKNGKAFMKDSDWDNYCFISLEEIDENEEVEQYCTSDYYVVIDENGYLCNFEKNELISDKSRHKCYLDKDGSTYYDTEVVGWDSEGNIVFPELYSELSNEEETQKPNKTEGNTLLFAVMIALFFFYRVILSGAVSRDAKLRGLKKEGSYTDSVLICGIFAVIYYISVRNTAEHKEEAPLTAEEELLREYNSKKQKRLAVIMLISDALVLCSCLFIFINLQRQGYSLVDFFEQIIKLIK